MGRPNLAARNYPGTGDFFGDEARFRFWALDVIRSVYESFGFEPLVTPMIETEDTLTGKYGQEGETKRFRLSLPFPNQGGLRYDHTVPLARFMAANWNRFPLPYRRYAIGPVLRNETYSETRNREFTQCDFDTVGSSSPIIDAEIVAINYSVLTRLGFESGFTVMVNDRRLLNALVNSLGITDQNQILAIFRAWDKLEKTRPDKVFEALVAEFVKLELTDTEDEQAYADASTLISKKLDIIYNRPTEALLNLRGLPADRVLAGISKAFPTPEVQEAVANLSQLVSYVGAMGVPEDCYQVYPLLARGLDYYTGPIFETYVNTQGIGSISGGGRFDNLIEAMGGPDMAASGSSFGFERLQSVMEKIGLRPTSSQSTDVFVTIFDRSNLELMTETFRLTSDLRLTSYNVEVYTGDTQKLSKQIDIARRKNIPVVVILGPDELSRGEVVVKTLSSAAIPDTQWTIPLEDITSKIGELLAEPVL